MSGGYDPRACKIPMPFPHLTLAEVAEFERLERAGYGMRNLSRRYQSLLARRVCPDRGHDKGDAA